MAFINDINVTKHPILVFNVSMKLLLAEAKVIL